MTDREKRCEDCAYAKKVNGCLVCEECFNQKCADIDDCPEGIEIAEIEDIAKKTKDYKVEHGASAQEVKKDKKPRTVVISDEKKALFDEIWTDLFDVFRENAQIIKENKLIQVKIGEKIFKIDIIEQRKPKK